MKKTILLYAVPVLIVLALLGTGLLQSSQSTERPIHVTSPKPNALLSDTFTIEGEARGMWFFEASFPVKLIDEDGSVISFGYIEAQGDWMTEDFVPFEGTLSAERAKSPTGILILQKDNPSGLPELDDEVRIPVRFDLSKKEQAVVRIFFYSAFDLETASYEASFPVTRAVSRTVDPIDAALRILFQGPTADEQKRGAQMLPALSLLADLYRGVTVNEGIATINMHPQALESLNAAAGIQGMVKAAIETTLLGFDEIDEVRYAIDGEVFTEWDA